MRKPTLLILAAGMGSRYGGLKQIDSVGPDGEIIIDYSIYDAIQAGFGKVVFVIRRDIADEFKAAIGDRFSKLIEVAYVFQDLENIPSGYTLPEGRKKPWGTAHAILSAKNAIQEPFAVINADDFYGAEGYTLLSNYLSHEIHEKSCTLIAFTLRKTLSEHGSVGRGVCQCTPEGLLETVTEFTQIEKVGETAKDQITGRDFTADEWVSMNMWGFHPSIFDILESSFSSFLEQQIETPKSEYQIPTVVDDQIKSGGLSAQALPTSSSWFGVTYTEDKPQVIQKISALIENGSYPSPLWKNA